MKNKFNGGEANIERSKDSCKKYRERGGYIYDFRSVQSISDTI